MYLKWAGGKTKIASKVARHFPKQIHGTYVEPFFGSGAMYFAMKTAISEPDLFIADGFAPSRYLFNDSNEFLINCHLAVKLNIDELEERLREKERLHKKDPKGFYDQEKAEVTCHPSSYEKHKNNTDKYYGLDMSKGCDVDRAATFIYINKACFNGLWRVNQTGFFNVPWNQNEEVNLVTQKLRMAHKFLQNCEFQLGEATDILDDLTEGDFVYLDPPYVPVSKSSHFTAYTKESFTLENLEKLLECCDTLTSRSIKWCMSNSNAPFVYETFKGYEINEIDAPRFIKPVKGDEKRETVKETIITNYAVIDRIHE